MLDFSKPLRFGNKLSLAFEWYHFTFQNKGYHLAGGGDVKVSEFCFASFKKTNQTKNKPSKKTPQNKQTKKCKKHNNKKTPPNCPRF